MASFARSGQDANAGRTSRSWGPGWDHHAVAVGEHGGEPVVCGGQLDRQCRRLPGRVPRCQGELIAQGWGRLRGLPEAPR
jgi:hypothetical protein